MKVPRHLSTGLKVLMTLLLLFFIFRSVDISKIGYDLKSFSGKTLILLLLLSWAGQMICAERWRILAASLQMPGIYRSFVQMYFAGMFFNIGLPSLVGGDVVKAYLVSRKAEKPLQTGLASVFQDRAAGLIALLVYGSIAIIACPIHWRGIPLWWAYALTWASVGFAFWLVLRGDGFYRKHLRPGGKSFLHRLIQSAADFHQSLGVSSLSRKAMMQIIFYSFIYAGLILWIFRQVTDAAGHKVGIVQFSALFPLITLGTMLPLTLGGLGIREWLYVEALGLVGMPAGQALVISLATSALYLLSNVAGVLFLPAIPMDLRSQAFDFPGNTVHPVAAEDRIPERNDVI